MGTEKPAVAVLGMGAMGRAMAGRLLAEGLPTAVWNRSPEPAAAVGGAGARVAADPADAVRDADVVVTMVTDAAAVFAVAEAFLPAVRRGAVWAQMSTIGLDGIERAAGLVRARRPDVLLVDAPVAGSRGPAEQGRLTVFAAGDDAARPLVGPVFDALGQRTVWVGPVGAGSAIKLVNNLVLAFAAQGLAESLGLADALGLDTATVLEALDGSPLVAPWAAQKLARIARDDYSPEYALALALKDVELALARTPIDRFSAANAVLGQWRRAVQRGAGGDDVTAVVREVRAGMHT
jgi:3-hydroxyisobutyrate dehydrogenase